MTAGDGPEEGDVDRDSDGDRQGDPHERDGQSGDESTAADETSGNKERDGNEDRSELSETDDETGASDGERPEDVSPETDGDEPGETDSPEAPPDGDTGGRFDDSERRRRRSNARHAHGAPESTGRSSATDDAGGDESADGDEGNTASADDSSDDQTTNDGEKSDHTDDRAGAIAAGTEQTGAAEGGSSTTERIADAAEGVTDSLSDDGGAFEGAPDDEEMPLTEHIEEMIKRLGIVLVIMAAVSLVTFPIADWLINTLWYSFLPGGPEQCAGGVAEGDACPRVYHPLGLIFARLKVASLAGFIIALPAFVYQTYLFMRPGLYPHERRYYLASVPTSLVLALVGVAFAYFLVLPFIFTYFLAYSEPVADIAFGLTETFDLILLMMGLFAAIFQIPLFIMLAIMMGVTTRRWLAERRLLFWASFGGIAFLFSPDPTGMAPILVAATMIVLFEGTLLALRWTNR